MSGLSNRLRDWLIDAVRVEVQRETQSREEQAQLVKQILQDIQSTLAKQVSQTQFESIVAEIVALKGVVETQVSLQHSAANQLLTAGLCARAARLAAELAAPAPARPANRTVTYNDSIEKLKALNPRLFPIWMELFDNGATSYVEERLGSCSHRESYYAKLFGAYCDIHGHGQILDVGCGPHGMPAYLALRDPRLVSGLEPLPLIGKSDFEVLRGFNEFLPWEDAQFDTVVSGTSLDHVLSLDASMQEVARVLRPRGKYIVWLASIPGAAPYDEKSPDLTPIDRFHLFHFDREWIEPLFERHFSIGDVTIIPQPGFDHVFYCMTPR